MDSALSEISTIQFLTMWKVIEVCFRSIFEKAGWLDTIPFVMMIDGRWIRSSCQGKKSRTSQFFN